ncbi:site-specific integrase [Ferrovibrio sp.]|uniref:site-specific integrase n=1 Tax=Ferrovibrio sp. TaxID=1917215 RepID=UPI0026107A0B|nr:site-specific integrase [Ferrovibrio sp.]
MSTIEKRRNGQYRAKVRRYGINQTRTFKTRRAAEDWANQIEGRALNGEAPTRRLNTPTLEVAIEWFLDRVAPRNPDQPLKRRGPTQHARNQIVHGNYWLGTIFAEQSLHSISKANLDEWRRAALDEDSRDPGEIIGPDAEFGPQTAIHRLNFLSRVYNVWADLNKVQIVNPVGPGLRPRMPKHRTRRLLPDEEQRLFVACSASGSVWLRPMVEFALGTAMRQGEILRLTWRHVNFDQATAFLAQTKNGEERTVPLFPSMVDLLSRQLPHGTKKAFIPAELTDQAVFPPKTGRGVTHAFAKACMAAKLTDLHFHDLRHEATSRLFEHTDLRDLEIAMITGHRSLEMLDRYKHLRANRLSTRMKTMDTSRVDRKITDAA